MVESHREKGEFRLQQHLISHHYRILDSYDDLWFSSFEKAEALERLDELFWRRRKRSADAPPVDVFSDK